MRKWGVYVIASLIKLLFWAVLLTLDLTLISIKDDTAIALTLWLVGVFLLIWWASYFIFYRWQWLFTTKVPKEVMQKDAYKCSFLFGLFWIINILLLVAELWNKRVGIVCLIFFIAMQYIILSDPIRSGNARTPA